MPAIDVREDYKRRRLRITPQGWEGELGWTVAYAPDVMSALQASGIPVRNAVHPLNSLLICVSVEVLKYNFNLSEVRAVYRQTSGDATDPNPLLKPPVMRFGRASRSALSDRDSLGNLIANSAGDPYQGHHRTWPIRTFTITRNEPYWDPRLDATYADTLNSQTFSPLGIPSLGPGQCHLLSVLPGADLMRGMRYVPVVYSFEYAAGENQVTFPRNVGGVTLWDAFLTQLPDVGTLGWFQGANGPARGQFCDATNRVLTQPVALDGTGKPINTTIQVRDPVSGTTYPPISAPTANQGVGARVHLSNPDFVRMVYPEIKVADFNVFRF